MLSIMAHGLWIPAKGAPSPGTTYVVLAQAAPEKTRPQPLRRHLSTSPARRDKSSLFAYHNVNSSHINNH
jgi:hypothetical protein